MIIRSEEEGLEYEVHIDGIHLEYVSEFKYLRCVWINQTNREVP